MNESDSVEVTDLKQWAYCPRVVYYRYSLPSVRPITRGMQAGIDRHQDEGAREERRSLRSYGLTEGERAFEVVLRSHTLRLRGRLDLAIVTPGRDLPGAEAIVVEYKDSERPGAHFKLQLAAYALLLEEAWGLPVRRGFIYSIPERKASAVPINKPLRDKTLAALAALHSSIDGEHMPEAPASRRQCVSCEFRRFCNDVV
jgi:CRISPR-associated exonuclease Cas4